MKPLQLDEKSMNHWRSESWFDYASETRDGERIRLCCSPMGEIKVLKANREIWRGKCVETAIEKFMFC